VIGYVPTPEAGLVGVVKEAFRALLLQSRIRGTHAYGLAQDGRVVKSTIDALVGAFDPRWPAVAHARYSTSGDWTVPENNQPIVVDRVALAFNGVIDMGTKEEFERRWGVRCDTANDGELFLRRQGSAEQFVATMGGSFAGVWADWGARKLHALRNERRPLWSSDHLGARWYASTRDIFVRAGFESLRELVPLKLEVVEWP